MKAKFKKKTIAKILLCVIWLGIIFFNATRQGETSQKSSKEVSKVISVFLQIPQGELKIAGVKFSDVNYFVRKNAHFFQYLIFSILICGVIKQFKLYKTSEIFLILFLLLFFSVIDEFIQIYIPDRTSNIFDIIIDFSGGILGMLIYNMAYKMKKKKGIVKG